MKFLPNVVAALVAGLLVNASVLYAEENDNCLAVVPSDYQWTNPSFTYTKNSVSRGNQSSNTNTVMQKEFAGDLDVAAKVELLGLGYSDGKGILIQGKNGYLMSVALDDSAPLIMWSTKQSKVVSSVQGVPTVLGRKYGFHIKVTETTITGTVDGFVVSAPNELTPPYKIGVIAQRSGVIVSDIVVCETNDRDNDGVDDDDDLFPDDPKRATIIDHINCIIEYVSDDAVIFDSDWQNKKMRNAYLNKLEVILELVTAAEAAEDPEAAALIYAEALDKVNNDLIKKTDGLQGVGASERDDWLKVQEAQDIVYPDLLFLSEYLLEKTL